jgi:hypothetical protein
MVITLAFSITNHQLLIIPSKINQAYHLYRAFNPRHRSGRNKQNRQQRYPLTFITIISFGNIASHSYPTFRTIILISTFRDKDVSVSVDRYRARRSWCASRRQFFQP